MLVSNQLCCAGDRQQQYHYNCQNYTREPKTWNAITLVKWEEKFWLMISIYHSFWTQKSSNIPHLPVEAEVCRIK